MGCNQSKNNHLAHLDDSVKVMIKHDAKMLEKKGQKPSGYVPRAPHPLLKNTNEENDNGGGGGGGDNNEQEVTETAPNSTATTPHPVAEEPTD